MSLKNINAFYNERTINDNGWYLFPRAQYFNEQNFLEWYKVLRWMSDNQYVKIKDTKGYQYQLGSVDDENSFVYSKWDQQHQKRLFNFMKSEGIIKPYAENQSLNDQLANVRNYLNLLKKLGFGYVNKEKHLHISSVGEEYLNANDISARKQIFEKQLVRIQLWNPSLEGETLKKYKKYKLFPFLFILELLSNIDGNYLTVEEFAVIVAFAREQNEIKKIINLIYSLRSLSSAQLAKLNKKLSFPQKANASVHLGAFGITPSLKFDDGKLNVVDLKYVRSIISMFKSRLKFIEYQTFEDWYQNISELEPGTSLLDVMRYYIEIGDEEKAKSIVVKIDKTKKVDEEIDTPDFQKALEELIQEKMIEDILEKNVGLLEDGLTLVANGRQFTTEVGRIDLLTTDSSGQFVVIELKKDRLEDEVVGQCLRYMGWVRSNLSPSKKVRGIVVGKQLSSKLRHAIIGMQHPDINLIKTKQFNLEVKANLFEVS